MKPKFLNLVIPWQVLLILLELIAVTIFALGQPASQYVFLNWIAIVAACSAVLIILIWLPQKLPGRWLKLLRRLLHDLSADTGQLLIIHLVGTYLGTVHYCTAGTCNDWALGDIMDERF